MKDLSYICIHGRGDGERESNYDRDNDEDDGNGDDEICIIYHNKAHNHNHHHHCTVPEHNRRLPPASKHLSQLVLRQALQFASYALE